MHEIPELDRKGLRDFGLVTGAIFVALFGLFFPWLLELNIPTWPWVLGSILAVWGLAAPATLRPLYRAWMKLGLMLSKITTPIVLGIVFFPGDLSHRPCNASARTGSDDAPNRHRGDFFVSGSQHQGT